MVAANPHHLDGLVKFFPERVQFDADYFCQVFCFRVNLVNDVGSDTDACLEFADVAIKVGHVNRAGGFVSRGL